MWIIESMKQTGGLHTSLLLVSLLFAGACSGGGDGPTSPERVATLELDKAQLAFDAIGASVQLQVTARDEGGSVLRGVTVTWSSSDASIANIQGGTVRSVGNGAARITATAGAASASADVVVAQVGTAVQIVAPETTIFNVGGTLQLEFEVVDRQGTPLDEAFEALWASDTPAVISVDGTGMVTSESEGTAVIRITVEGFNDDEQLSVVRDIQGIVAFKGASVLTMDGGGALADQTVITEDGVITAIGPAGTAIPPGASVVDATGLFLMPGLTDAHAHPREETDLMPYLANGVTTIINLGNPSDTPVLGWRDEVVAGQRLGPTIYSTGQIIDGENPRAAAAIVTSPAAGRSEVQRQINAGVDFLKVYNGLSVPTFQAIMEEARTAGVHVIGHGVRAPGLDGILDAGVVAIAHMEEVFYTHFSSNMDPSLIPSAVETVAGSGAWIMPNLSTFGAVNAQWGNTPQLEAWLTDDRARYLSPERQEAWRRFHQNAYANRTGSVAPLLTFLADITRAMHEGGVPFLLSTDSPIIPGMFPGFTIHDDLRRLVGVGLTPTEAMEVGTSNAGAFVARHRTGTEPFGTVTVGSRADLILLDTDPRVDLNTLKTPHGVMVRGRYLSNLRLEQLLEEMVASWGGNPAASGGEAS